MQPNLGHTLSSSLTHFHTFSFVPQLQYFFPEGTQLSFSDINKCFTYLKIFRNFRQLVSAFTCQNTSTVLLACACWLLAAPAIFVAGESHSEFGPIDGIKNTHLETDFYVRYNYKDTHGSNSANSLCSTYSFRGL